MIKNGVDFAYAFSTPHRVCICMPDASKKSLWDASGKGLTVTWSDGDLTTNPLGAYKPVKIDCSADFTAEADGVTLVGKSWRRADNRIPSIEYNWKNDNVNICATAVAVKDADVLKLHVINMGSARINAGVYGKTSRMCVNTKWIESDSPYNALLAHDFDRSDRMVFLAIHNRKGSIRNWSSIDLEWELGSGEEASSYIIRPHFALIDDIMSWLARDWEMEMIEGLDTWRRLLNRAPKFHIPDLVVEDAFYATLADMFVMREPQGDGHIAGTAGTEVYRAANTGEPCFQSMILNRMGYFQESRDEIEFTLQFQEPDGNWEDYRRWGHHIWGTSGIKSWAVKEYYLYTHDREFLEKNFERMLASARWSNKQRSKSKMEFDEGKKPLTWGLMPRGLGDCGLMNGDDLFGVFYPSNFGHCMGLEIAVWAAKELGRADVLEEITGYYNDLHRCLMDSLEYGAIKEKDGKRWIPGTPGKTSGSRWGAADAIWPYRIIPPYHPLADGTMAKLEEEISEGGLPKNLGWLKDGLWVAIALDAVGYAHIMRGEEDTVTDYLYATLNHGTPLFTWCEERLPEKETKTITGDLQHAWTPIAVSRIIRDSMLMEEEGCLHIARVVPRHWLDVGNRISVENAPTHWGKVSYSFCREDKNSMNFSMDLKGESLPEEIVLHVRIPDKREISTAAVEGCKAGIDGNRVVIKSISGLTKIRLTLDDKVYPKNF